MPPRGRAAGRPGLSPVRLTRSYVLPADALQRLHSVKTTIDAPGMSCEVTSPSTLESRKKAEREASEKVRASWTRNSASGERAAVHYEIDPGDLAEIRQAIRQGKQHSDLLIATIHAHETGLGCEEPGDYLPIARPRRDRRRRRHLHRARRAPPHADRDLQGAADLLQPRQLFLERHPRADPGRDLRGEPRSPEDGLRRVGPTHGRGPADGMERQAASTIRVSSRPSSPSAAGREGA